MQGDKRALSIKKEAASFVETQLRSGALAKSELENDKTHDEDEVKTNKAFNITEEQTYKIADD